MTPNKLDKTKKTSSNVQGSGFDVKIISPKLPSDFLIENKEDKTEEILEEYSRDSTRIEFNNFRQEVFTLFGIFASVVAFLLVEVQILKTATSWQILAGVSLILLGTMSFFVLLIRAVLSQKDKTIFDKFYRNQLFMLLFVSIIFIVFGICLASKGDNEKFREEMKIEYSGNLYGNKNFRLR